ncbi:MAG: sulfotransferase [Alphaproteobacteria bacterium]
MLNAEKGLPTTAVALPTGYQQALSLHRQGRLGDAKAAYETLVHANPGFGDAWFGLATIQAQMGVSEEAIIGFERAMAILGPRAEIHHNMAAAKSARGRMTEADAHYREAIRLKPDYYEAYFNFANVKTFSSGRPVAQTIEQLLARPELTPTDRCFLHFAAGKIYDDMGDADAAFPHFLEGNKAKGVTFDAQGIYDEVASLSRAFDVPTIERLKGQGCDDPRIVLVVGMPRSGTTLVEQILASHGAVAGAGELGALTQTARGIAHTLGGDAEYPNYISRLEGPLVAKFGRAYAEHLAERAGPKGASALRIVDKTPLNFRHLGLAYALLPRVRIIHCRRHPLDTCLSCFFQNFRSGQAYSFDLEMLGFYYGQYHWLMGHWARAGIPMLEVDYATLVGDLEGGARRLLDFIGLEWDSQVMDFHETSRDVQTASRAQVRRPIYTSSVNRWVAYDRYLEPLKAALTQAGVPLPAAD